MTNDPIVCDCNMVNRSTIETAIREQGFKTVDQINKEFYLDKACGACLDEVQFILNESKGN